MVHDIISRILSSDSLYIIMTIITLWGFLISFYAYNRTTQKKHTMIDEKTNREVYRIHLQNEEMMNEVQSLKALIKIQNEKHDGFSDVNLIHSIYRSSFPEFKATDGENIYLFRIETVKKKKDSEKECASDLCSLIMEKEDHFSETGLAYSSRISDIESTVSNILHITRTPVSGIKIATRDIMKLTDDDRIHKQCEELNDLADMIEEEISVFLQKPLQNDDKTEEISSRIIHDCDMIKLTSDKKINIRYKLPKEKYMIPVDKANCIMMCSNCILENAMYYTSDNGFIDIELVIDDDVAEYSITNYGPPIDQKDIDKIFVKGYSCKGSSGAGLYLAKTVANQCLNADIIVKNNSENGVTFTMVLKELL